LWTEDREGGMDRTSSLWSFGSFETKLSHAAARAQLCSTKT
jgi:hypothetical protein